jgi:hypothetical protein
LTKIKRSAIFLIRTFLVGTLKIQWRKGMENYNKIRLLGYLLNKRKKTAFKRKC